jgi:Polyphosphate kinase 2 (PPK2)/XFP C-terminal domain
MNDEVETVAQATKEGAKEKLKEKTYLKKLRKLQEEVCTLQDWVKHTGQRIVIVFEGRDAAGKGGIIRALTERVNPRVFRVVALPAPSVEDVIDRLPQLGARAAYFKQAIHEKLVDHREYIEMYGDDMPEISSWKWGLKGKASGSQKTTTEGDNI